jgi:hypothetical protein
MEFCVSLGPQGWKEKHPDNPADAQQPPEGSTLHPHFDHASLN